MECNFIRRHKNNIPTMPSPGSALNLRFLDSRLIYTTQPTLKRNQSYSSYSTHTLYYATLKHKPSKLMASLNKSLPPPPKQEVVIALMKNLVNSPKYGIVPRWGYRREDIRI